MGIIGRFPSFPLQHTVAVPLQIPRFQVWGSNPSQGHFFAFFLVPTFCNGQLMENILLNNFIDSLMSCHSKRIALTGIWTPYLENSGIWCGFYAYSVECQVSDHSRHELNSLDSVHSICHLIDRLMDCLDWDSNPVPGKRGIWNGTGSGTVCL